MKKDKEEKKMSQNKNKSRRHWKYSGYKECHECAKDKIKRDEQKTYNYDTWTSEKPYRLTLCHDCYEWIYVFDRKQPTLFNFTEGEGK